MRRLLFILGGLLLVSLLALGTLPLWLGPALRPIGARWGLSYATYERVGYGRFALRDVVYTHPAVRVTAERVEVDTPLLWLWRHGTGNSRDVKVTRWLVVVNSSAAAIPPTASTASQPAPSLPASSSSLPPANPGAMRLRTILLAVAAQLDRWLPRAEAGAGAVRWTGAELKIASAAWQQRTLVVRRLGFGTHAADVTIKFPVGGAITLDAISAGKGWRAALKNQGDEITGDGSVWEQTATLSAHFAERGWMPASAEVRAANWSVPAARLKLGEFYSVVRGDARLDWKDGKFETSADATGVAIPDKQAPPLTVKLGGHGDAAELTVESLLVEAPGVSAKLSAPVVLDRKGIMRSGASVFSVAVDLAKQPWFAAGGQVTGEARLTPREGSVPRIEAKLDGRDVTFREWSGIGVAVEASLEWPRLQVKTATLALNESDKLAVHGAWDFSTNELSDAEVTGPVSGKVLAHWLPAAVAFRTVTLAAKAHGPLAALQHEGTAHVAALAIRGLRPLEIDAAWHGTGAATEVSEAKARSGASEISFTGTLDAAGAKLSALHFKQGGTERLALAQPAAVRWSPAIEVGPLQLAGADSSLALTLAWGARGRVEVTARNISSTWWGDLVALPGPAWQLSSLAVKGEWNDGPMAFTANGELAVELAPARFAAVSLDARGDGEGMRIETLRAAEGAAPILTATGRVPLILRPGGAGTLVNFDEAAPLALHAATTSNPDFWKKLMEATGLELQEPEVTAELSGTWAHPKGELNAKVARVAADPQRIKWRFPVVEGLDVHAIGNRAGVTIERLTVKVDGQAVSANGQLPLSPARWAEFKGDPLTFVRKEGNLHLEIPDAEVAVIARYVPAWIAPAGRVQLDVTLKPGGDMQGTVKLQGAASRPLGPLGVLQEINADVQLAGRSVEVRSVTALSGGQPVTLTGTIQLPLNAVPKYDLALKGTNLPLVRQTGLLLRADLDLKFATQGDGVPAVTGSVALRDSMFLSDVRALIPRGGRGGGPARRPPYFAVETPPLNAWRLNIDVHGEQFLRLRSTAFVGMASARFRLTGTLGDPRATGEAVLDSGQVKLPFAAFKIEQGAVRLTEADPYSLALFVTGTTRRYGYDIRMEITGTATDPVVTFTSSPPLEARQTLLMVMAGEMPHDDVAVYGSNQRVARLGAYLGQSLISSFGGDESDADRLSISTGERVSRQGRETYNIEYQMNDRFSLVGEYDEFDDYNAGVKWRMIAPEKKAAAPITPPSAVEKKEAAHDQPR